MLCLNCGREIEGSVRLCPECHRLLNVATGSRTDLNTLVNQGVIFSDSQPAGFFQRSLALVLDSSLILFCASALIDEYHLDKALQQRILPQLEEFVSPVASWTGGLFSSHAIVLLAFLLTAQMLLGLPYYVILEASRLQATLGKLLLDLRVTDIFSRRLSWSRACGRHLARFTALIPLFYALLLIPSVIGENSLLTASHPILSVSLYSFVVFLFLCFFSFLLITYLAAIFSSSQQGLHDIIAGSLVVRPLHTNVLRLILVLLITCPLAVISWNNFKRTLNLENTESERIPSKAELVALYAKQQEAVKKTPVEAAQSEPAKLEAAKEGVITTFSFELNKLLSTGSAELLFKIDEIRNYLVLDLKVDWNKTLRKRESLVLSLFDKDWNLLESWEGCLEQEEGARQINLNKVTSYNVIDVFYVTVRFSSCK